MQQPDPNQPPRPQIPEPPKDLPPGTVWTYRERWHRPPSRKFDWTFRWFEEQADPNEVFPKPVRMGGALMVAIGFFLMPFIPFLILIAMADMIWTYLQAML